MDSNQNINIIKKFINSFLEAGLFEQVGFTITIVGFLVTSVSAILALKVSYNIKNKIISVNNISDLSKALSLVEEIRRFSRMAGWIVLPELCTQLRHILISIDNNSNLLDAQKKLLEGSIKKLRQFEEKINTNWQTGLTADELSKADSLLRSQSDVLNQIIIQIKNKVK